MNGTIHVDYKPGSGTFTVSNGGGKSGEKVAQFLQAHHKHFGKGIDDNGLSQSYWIEAERVGKFKLYAQSKGFEVVVGR
jgi:hypothetical protein